MKKKAKEILPVETKEIPLGTLFRFKREIELFSPLRGKHPFDPAGYKGFLKNDIFLFLGGKTIEKTEASVYVFLDPDGDRVVHISRGFPSEDMEILT